MTMERPARVANFHGPKSKPVFHYSMNTKTPFTRYSRLSNRLSNATGLKTVLNEQLFVQPVVKPGCTTGLTTGLTTGCIV